MPASSTVVLVDVDNTLFDNDRFQADLKDHLAGHYGAEARDRYWEIQEALFAALGYRDYLGALQSFRMLSPFEVERLSLASFLMDYPFAEHLFEGAHEVLERLGTLGPTVLLSDGDAVFQPHKIARAGLAAAVNGRVLIYVHKEAALGDIERRYRADHYVMVDDKPHILAAVKQSWGPRVTTVLPRQGVYARQPQDGGLLPPPDLTVEAIGDLLRIDLAALVRQRADPSTVPR